LSQRLGVVVGEFTPGELLGAGGDLVAQGVALAKQLHGLREKFFLATVMAEGEFLGNELVDFGREIRGLGGPPGEL
jgi:hypothetical protein